MYDRMTRTPWRAGLFLGTVFAVLIGGLARPLGLLLAPRGSAGSQRSARELL